MMARVMNQVLGAALFAALLFAGYQTVRAERAEQAGARAQMARDSLAAEMVVARAAASGWEVMFATVVPDLRRELADADSMLTALLVDLEASNVRVESLTRVLASVRDSIDTLGAPVPTEEGKVLTWDMHEGEVADGVLTLPWRFTCSESRLTTRGAYSVAMPIEMVRGRAGDGRIIVSARALVPQGTVVVEDLIVTPPAPVVQLKTNWKYVAGLSLLFTLLERTLIP